MARILDFTSLVNPTRKFYDGLGLIAWLALAAPSHAAQSLPYSTRTQPFSGWATQVRGDIRTVGMAGATVGLADTFIASLSNPAGLAMSLNQADANFSGNSIRDSQIQDPMNPITAHSFGAALALYPWGVSMGFVSNDREGQGYLVNGSPSESTTLGVTTREFRISAARVLFENRLSLGVSLRIGQGEREMEGPSVPEYSYSHHSYAIGATLGAQLQLPDRILLGISYSLPMSFPADTQGNPTPLLPNFVQPIEVPGTIGLGVGWIPNRYFRTDFTTFVVGRAPSALLGNESVRVGESVTIQPRVGAAYVFADFENFTGRAYSGIYYEVTRLSDASNRIHLTGGIELRPWILSLGWGIDIAPRYQNYLISVGLNLLKTMQKLDLLPDPPRKDSGRSFPPLLHDSDDGLPRPLVKNWHPERSSIDPIQAGLEIPEKLQKKLESAADAVIEVFGDDPQVKPKTKRPKSRASARSRGLDSQRIKSRQPGRAAKYRKKSLLSPRAEE